MSSPFIWAGNYAKSLKSFLNLNDQVYIINGSADPTSVAQNGPAGSIYQRTNGSVYVKQDAGTTTNWTIFSTGGGGGTTTAQRVTELDSFSNNGTSLPASRSGASIIIVGTTAYMYGGYDNAGNATTSIYSADLSTNPASWTSTGNTLPSDRAFMHVARIGSTIYFFGGFNTGNNPQQTIYSASTASPSVVTDTGSTTNQKVAQGNLAMIGSKIYIFGGQYGAGTISSTILSATIASPLSWSTEGNTLPAARAMGQLFVAGNAIVYAGGKNAAGSSTNTIYVSQTETPTSFVTSSNTLGANTTAGAAVIANNRLFICGGYTGSQSAGSATTAILSATVDNPTSFTTFSSSLSTATSAAECLFYNGHLYIYGGTTSGDLGNSITTIQNTANYVDVKQPTYSGLSTNIGGPSFDLGGQNWVVSTYDKLGYAPWFYDDTKPA